MEIINRSAISVKYKKPFIDWCNNLMPLNEKIISESSVYLVPELDETDTDAIKKYHKVIFETELFQMWTDENAWPPKITVTLFYEWFSAEICGWVYDLDRKNLGRSKFDI